MRLYGADAASFKAPNRTVFAADKYKIYTITSTLKGADVESFHALDDGENLEFQGYGADKNHVFYHDFDSKAKVLKSADTASFKSLGDGYFAKDRSHIYGCGKVILGADMASFLVVAPKNAKMRL